MDSLMSLFNATSIGTMQMKNRIIMAPMGTLFANGDGTVSECTCRYYEERAKGGDMAFAVLSQQMQIAHDIRVDHPHSHLDIAQIDWTKLWIYTYNNIIC